jgi:hypothetical protein
MNATCSICIDDIEGTNNSLTTDCGHCFHTNCFLMNVSHNGFNCPNCRNQLIEEPECDDSDDEDDEDDYSDDSNDSDDEDEEEDETTEDFSLRGLRWLFQRVDDLEEDEEDEEDETAEDFSLRGLRWLFQRVDDDDDEDYDDDDEDDYDEDEDDALEYERGHSRFGEQDLEPISLHTIGEHIRQRGITHDDLVAIIAFPHKDHVADMAAYPHTRLMEIHTKLREILEGIPFVPEPSVVGKGLTMEDLTVASETIFEA